MCQCHTMWQSEGAMQVQVAHSKKIPPGEKKFLHGVPAFFSGGTPQGGGGYGKKIGANFFSTPPPGRNAEGVSCDKLKVGSIAWISFHGHGL